MDIYLYKVKSGDTRETSDLYYSLCDVKSTFYYKPFKTLLRNFMKQREFILQVLSP